MAGRRRYGRACWMAMLAIACMHAARGEHSGSATYYEPPYTPTECYHEDRSGLPANGLFGAVSGAEYKGGAACGAYYTLTCLGGINGSNESRGSSINGSINGGINDGINGGGCRGPDPVRIKIVDLCSDCAACELKLSFSAFAALTSVASARRVPVLYRRS